MKKLSICLILISSILFFGGCNNEKSLTNNSKIKENPQTYENDKFVDSYNLDEIYGKIKDADFSDAKLVDDLDYDKINKTLIIVGEQSLGARDTLTDQQGNSTQRFLNFSMENGTQITVILGELSKGENIEKNMIINYTDNYKNMNSGTASEVHLDSALFSVNNIMINVVSINIKDEIDLDKIINFKEEFAKYINSITY